MSLPPGQGAPVLQALMRCGLATGLLLACAPPAAAAEVEALLAEPTPLVLKDGRIARVGVYAVIFPVASAELAPDALKALDTLIDAESTDCFLTAQAIGHAEPAATNSGDALAAHRLARARAERVQKEMVDRGLAATAIASVWDWQFVVKEPRVTLWVFNLPEGSDCKGTSLAHPHTAVSAATEPGPATVSGGSAEEPPPPHRPAPPALPSTAAASPPDQPAKTKQESPSTEVPEPIATVEAPAGPIAPAPGSATTPAAGTQSTTPAPGATVSAASSISATSERNSPSNDSPDAETSALGQPDRSVPGTPEALTPPPSAPDRVATAASDGETVSNATADVLFEVNSSFLSKAAGQALQDLADRLRPGGHFMVELTASVGGEVRDASGQQADTYNHWMAERRIGRVTDWLRRNAGTATLEFKPDFVDEGGAPRVSVRLEPTG